MRALLTCLLIAWSGPALAMNWEGHDDWMADQGPALLLREAIPEARSLPPPVPDCQVASRTEVRNPYEQIPLQRPDCRAQSEERENGR